MNQPHGSSKEPTVGQTRIPALWKHVERIIPCDMSGRRTPSQWRSGTISLFFSEDPGKGIWHYGYEVERMTDGSAIYLTRATFKLGMDYVVVYKDAANNVTGHSFDSLDSDLAAKKNANRELYKSLESAAKEVQAGDDPDAVLDRFPNLRLASWTGLPVENLLKVMKWVFIDEDIKYWHGEGRQMWKWKERVDRLAP